MKYGEVTAATRCFIPDAVRIDTFRKVKSFVTEITASD